MSKKNKRIRFEKMITRLCQQINPKYKGNDGRVIKDIDGGRKHKPKGQR